MAHAVREIRESGQPRRGSWGTASAFLIGVPLGVGLLALIQRGPWQHPLLVQYTKHPVEMVCVALFACAMGALLTKLIVLAREWAALKSDWLPPWDGRPVAPNHAGELLEDVRVASRGMGNTHVGRRIVGVLDFVHKRQSANNLDDRMRGLMEDDDIALENSYSLIRFITWAIPILGFLGTVLGITGAISGVNPQVLEQNLSQVTNGLGTAFDTTAAALALTMATMFCSFVVERLEQTLLDRVNQFCDANLAHRFERTGPNSGEFISALQRNTNVLLAATEKIVQRQAQLWRQSIDEAGRHWTGAAQRQQEALVGGLAEALGRTAEAHAGRLAEQEQKSMQAAVITMNQLNDLTITLNDSAARQQQTLSELMHQVAAQTEALVNLTQQGSRLVQLQEVMQQNLNSLAAADTFEQAVSSLTAAIHLLTARANGIAKMSDANNSRKAA